MKIYFYCKKIVCLAIGVLILMITVSPADVYAADDDIVTIAYIDYKNFISGSEDGSYSGYGDEYLSKISDYTGWKYKYVEMDWPEAYKAVRDGTIDFYCVARQTEERLNDFDFSLYPVCNEEMNIYTLKESEICYEYFEAFDGLRVGILENSGEIDYFKEYAKDNSFSYTLVKYSLNEAAIEALNKGEVDAVALVNYSVDSELKNVGNFGVSPAYMMSCDGSGYMKDFSKAQEKLLIDEPDFARELEKKYYGDWINSDNLLLTYSEKEYIKNCDVLNVAISHDMVPTEYYDDDSGKYCGMTVEIYNKISELTGLKFNFIRREDSDVLIEQMRNGETQLIGAMAKSREVEQALDLIQTKTFTENSFSVVKKKSTYLDDDSVVAVPSGYPQFNNTAKIRGYCNICEYDSFEDCVKAVEDGKADLTYVITMSCSYLLNHVEYSDLSAVKDSSTDYGICFGVAKYENSDILMSVINKSLAAVPQRDINEIIVRNTANASPKTSISDFISKNGLFILISVILILVAITLLILNSQKAKQKKTIIEKEKKHYDFLQHLYNTIPCGVFQYNYEEPHQILNFNTACAKIYGFSGDDDFIGKTSEAVVAPDSADDFKEKFKLCDSTEGPVMYICPIVKSDGSIRYTECVMDVVETDHGKVFQEVFVDVTERTLNEQLTEKRYMRELNRHGKSDNKSLYFACFDITEQIITETDIDVEGVHAGISVNEFIDALLPELSEMQTEEQLNDFCTRFSYERMENEYENDCFEISFDLCRRKDGQFQWLRSELTLSYNPVTDHLMCFDYVLDITDERVTASVMRTLALSGCEEFMCIDAKTGRCLEYTVEGNREHRRSETVYGKTDIISRIADKITSEQKNEFLAQTEQPNVYDHLKNDGRYCVYVTMKDENGERTDKSLTFFFIDIEHHIVAMIVSDITEVRAGEVRHAQLLSDALAAAEKADAAKSQFLSRVSHEMRTPLNAIIGFIELSKEAEREKVENYLASSDIAAKQLLNVINDVLDMSSIESGKMKIANASFNFKHLIFAVTNIYGMQCNQKNITFETKITTEVDEWLVGDELRVNQILINLLGNSVKFTQEGCIRLKISENIVDNNRAFICFEVSDTGCGMSEQMKEKIFKPFEQESAATAKKYGGSGLGLSIVKNLVCMMDGSIHMESEQGKGTTFVIEIPFGRSDVEHAVHLPDGVEQLHVLAIDDEKTEREYIGLVLRRMKVRFTCVESGNEALAELEKSKKENDMYNVCIVDWRMPGMNGHDTTSRIREKYGKDLVVIVVSAYDFQQAGDSAREAGANLFLSKPIFQSSLFDLFMTLTGGRIAKLDTQPQSWDFEGKRVLLAEDNKLNQIVTKGYLSKLNVICDVAENGKIAVQKFIDSPHGYYKAILMDVQMPVMDGYEATRTIRDSSHPDALTVPIIAQTADAFNEDISRALSNGMDYHVSKPIEPDMFAKTLYKAFSSHDNINNA